MVNPLMVINNFFNAGKLTEHRKHLKRWRKCVVTKKQYHHKKHGPADLVFFYELNLTLLEAAYLILHDQQQNSRQRKEITNGQLADEQSTPDLLYANLSLEEQLNPYQALKRIFKRIKPQMYRDHLAEWLLSAFRKVPIDESIMPGEVISIYENLQKLYEATWLIEQRHNKHAEQE